MKDDTRSKADYLTATAALSAAAAVGLGAYGAHGLNVEQSLIEIWETAVSYQMWHALGAFAAAALAGRRAGRARLSSLLSGWLLLAGALAFSISLYLFVINGIVPIEGMAPAGGTLMIIGWLGFAIAALQRGPKPDF
ncbi:MAG: DUF423 domain-containing protein [Rhodospirillales bacterium]